MSDGDIDRSTECTHAPASNRVREAAQRAFEVAFGRRASWIASAPGRVNLIGEFTDYNNGHVLPMALDSRTFIAAAPNGSDRITVCSEATQECVTLESGEVPVPDPKGRWTNYVKGVLAGFVNQGLKPCGFDANIHSEVPMGAGLSSSAALEVAFATLLEGVCGIRLDGGSKAALCQQAEHVYAGVPCGIMDPFITSMARSGQVLLLDCRSREPLWLPFTDPTVSILLINTRVKHELANSAYAQRRLECTTAAQALGVSSLRDASLETLRHETPDMDPTVVRRARHVITEMSRVLQAAECVRAGDWAEFGQLLDASHESLRNDFEVSCNELDTVVNIAHGIGRRGGVYGCRMTGGGFGGCVVALISTARCSAIAEKISREYSSRTGMAADLLLSRPSDGAELLAFDVWPP